LYSALYTFYGDYGGSRTKFLPLPALQRTATTAIKAKMYEFFVDSLSSFSSLCAAIRSKLRENLRIICLKGRRIGEFGNFM
jgi:hypothetical protein